ncbi:trigger factor [bacterium]|nr:trigger factor [bacterium]
MTKATIEKQSAADVELKIVVSAKELQDAKAAVLAEAKKDMKISGFRPGQAPDAIAERNMDAAKLQLEVVEKVLAATFTEAVQGHGLKTLAQPKVDVKKFVPWDELEYEAKVAVLPEITYDYTKLKVKYDEVKLDEEEVDTALENLQQQFADRKSVKRAAKLGDEVRMDFKGVREGTPVEGAAGQNSMLVLGSGRFIPGFEDEIVGMKKGDKKSFDITFPIDYHATDLAGKKVTFTVTVNEVREVETLKLDDEFAKKVGGFKKLNELKEDIRKNLQEGKDNEAGRAYEAAVLAQAVKQTKVVISELLEDEQYQEIKHELEEQVKSSGMELDDWLKIQKKDEKVFKQELHDEAKRRIGVGLIIRDVIEKQKFEIRVDEVQDQIEKMRMTYTDPEVLEHLDHDHFKNDVANRLLTQKAVDWLCEQAKK